MGAEDRYSRQARFSGIGPAGQLKIRKARLVLVGCGALGTVSSEMLTRAGVGHLKLIDRDFVEWSNLQRQSLFTEDDAAEGRPKATAALRALKAVNSDVHLEAVVCDLDTDNIGALCGGADLLLDGSDNFETRYLINDYAVQQGIPWIYGAAVGSYGLGLAILPGQTPCLRCIFPDLPPAGEADSCDTAGIIAPIIHMVAGFQVTAAFRILIGTPPPSGLFQLDVWRDQGRMVGLNGPSVDCPCCMRREFSFLHGDRHSRSVRLCGRNSVQVRPPQLQPIDLEQLAHKLAPVCRVRLSPEVLRFFPPGYEVTLFPDGRAIVQGTEDPAEARSLYTRFVGV
jgi:molybdopterin-synthase adenylyltransferase